MDLSIIIVSNNHEEYVKKLLESIFKIKTSIKFEIILVDNKSSDNLVKYVKKFYTQVKLIEQKSKKGFSENNNDGIKIGIGKYVLLLNPDTLIIEDYTFDRMVHFMYTNDQIGIMGPKLLYGDGSLQLSCRNYPSIRSTIYRRTPLRKLILNSKVNGKFLMKNDDHNKVTDVDWMLGAALIMKKDIIVKLGGLDEKYFLYCEDIDLCYSIKELGYRIVYNPEIKIIHYLQESTFKKFLSKKTIWHYKSMFYYVSKNKFKLLKRKKYV